MQKRGPQKREKKLLSASGLLKLTKKLFEENNSTAYKQTKRPQKINTADCLMSSLAMFSLKSPSLLAFDQERNENLFKHNMDTLYGVKQVPSDTYMREILDEVDPSKLRNSFTEIFKAVQRGKLLDNYRFLDGYLLLIDGSGFFESDKIHCDDCCIKEHKNGKKGYYHQILGAVIAHPSQRQVIPLCPELINKRDGQEKNDCERRALQRLLEHVKREHPRLPLTIAYDALSANAPTINDIKSYGYHFIINVKPTSNKSLFEWIEGLELETTTIIIDEKHKYILRFINNVPLNDTKNSPNVNFLECKAIEINGKVTTEKIFTWVTDHVITKKKAYSIALGGRSRWKVENETFNTLKNQGYQFEHNFGHGKKHLTSVFALLMMLAFLIDQIQEAACALFQAARQKLVSRRSLWERIRSYFTICYVQSWEELFNAIIGSIKATLMYNSS